MQALEKPDKAGVSARCKDYLISDEIERLLRRRDSPIKHYGKMLAEKGDSMTYP